MKKKKIELTEMQKYKLALFVVIKNAQVIPQCMKMETKKTMREINTLSVATIDRVLDFIDYDLVVDQYEQGGGIL